MLPEFRMARFEDYSGPQPKLGSQYLRLMGLPYHLSEEGLIYHLEIMDATLRPSPEDVVFLSTQDKGNFGKRSGVCLMSFPTRNKRDQAVTSYNHQYIGSRYIDSSPVEYGEACRMFGQEGDRQRVLGYRRLLALAGANIRNMVQLDNLHFSVSRDNILRAAGAGANVIILTTVNNVMLRIPIIYATAEDASNALMASETRRIDGCSYTARTLGLNYATMIANRTEPPSTGLQRDWPWVPSGFRAHQNEGTARRDDTWPSLQHGQQKGGMTTRDEMR